MEQPQIEQRVEPRTNIFVVATLSSDTTSGSVRVRDIAPMGAKVEGVDLPDLGQRVRLRRGAVSLSGVLVRKEGKVAGVRFDQPTVVDLWLPGGQQGGQKAVDQEVRNIKLGVPPLPVQKPKRDLTDPDELHGIADMLDSLADAICNDPEAVAQFSSKLQVLDIAAQKLRGIATRER